MSSGNIIGNLSGLVVALEASVEGRFLLGESITIKRNNKVYTYDRCLGETFIGTISLDRMLANICNNYINIEDGVISGYNENMDGDTSTICVNVKLPSGANEKSVKQMLSTLQEYTFTADEHASYISEPESEEEPSPEQQQQQQQQQNQYDDHSMSGSSSSSGLPGKSPQMDIDNTADTNVDTNEGNDTNVDTNEGNKPPADMEDKKTAGLKRRTPSTPPKISNQSESASNITQTTIGKKSAKSSLVGNLGDKLGLMSVEKKDESLAPLGESRVSLKPSSAPLGESPDTRRQPPAHNGKSSAPLGESRVPLKAYPGPPAPSRGSSTPTEKPSAPLGAPSTPPRELRGSPKQPPAPTGKSPAQLAPPEKPPAPTEKPSAPPEKPEKPTTSAARAEVLSKHCSTGQLKNVNEELMSDALTLVIQSREEATKERKTNKMKSRLKLHNTKWNEDGFEMGGLGCLFEIDVRQAGSEDVNKSSTVTCSPDWWKVRKVALNYVRAVGAAKLPIPVEVFNKWLAECQAVESLEGNGFCALLAKMLLLVVNTPELYENNIQLGMDEIKTLIEQKYNPLTLLGGRHLLMRKLFAQLVELSDAQKLPSLDEIVRRRQNNTGIESFDISQIGNKWPKNINDKNQMKTFLTQVKRIDDRIYNHEILLPVYPDLSVFDYSIKKLEDMNNKMENFAKKKSWGSIYFVTVYGQIGVIRTDMKRSICVGIKVEIYSGTIDGGGHYLVTKCGGDKTKAIHKILMGAAQENEITSRLPLKANNIVGEESIDHNSPINKLANCLFHLSWIDPTAQRLNQHPVVNEGDLPEGVRDLSTDNTKERNTLAKIILGENTYQAQGPRNKLDDKWKKRLVAEKRLMMIYIYSKWKEKF